MLQTFANAGKERERIMKKNRKKAASLILASVMALAGCGAGSVSGTAKTSAESAKTSAETEKTESTMENKGDGKPVAIKFSWWGGDSRHEATEKAVEAFMVKYPNITVECEYGAWTGWEEKQALAIQGGNAADVMQINWNWITSYSGNGTNFADLSDYGDILDLSQFDSDVLAQCEADGKLMAVPVSMTGRLFYWNKTAFDEVGCDIPVDEASLLAAGQKFKEYNEDYYPLVMGEYDRAIFMVYYLESVYGKPWVENGKLSYTAEELQKGFEFITRLENEHVIPTVAAIHGDMADSLDKNAKWIDGKYAGIFEWDSSATKFQTAISESTTKPGQEFVIGDFVKLGDYNGGFTKVSMAFAVAANSEHPKEAALLINYLLNEAEGIEIVGTERGIPCSAQGVKLLNDKKIGNELVKEANARVLSYSRFPLDPMFEHNDLKANPDGVYYKVFGKLSAGDIDSKKAAEDLMKGIDECYND